MLLSQLQGTPAILRIPWLVRMSPPSPSHGILSESVPSQGIPLCLCLNLPLLGGPQSYWIRGPLCSSPTFSYLITWARTQFPKESHSRTLGVNTSTHLFRGHTSTPYRVAQVRQVLFAVCSMPGPGLNPGATEFPGRSLSSGNLQSSGERPTGVD